VLYRMRTWPEKVESPKKVESPLRHTEGKHPGYTARDFEKPIILSFSGNRRYYMAIVTDPTDLDKMRAACQAAAAVLDFITPHVKPGITTGELDRLCLQHMEELGVQS